MEYEIFDNLEKHIIEYFNNYVDSEECLEPLKGADINITEKHSDYKECSLSFEVSNTFRNPETLNERQITLGGFKLLLLPGTQDVYLSTGVWMDYRYQQKGIGSVLHKIRLDAARAAQVGSLVCTVNNYNQSELKILEKFGWKEIGEASQFTKLMHIPLNV